MPSNENDFSSEKLSPLRKVVFIKHVALFTCNRPVHAVKLTKGINSEFEETMINFKGFIECIINMARANSDNAFKKTKRSVRRTRGYRDQRELIGVFYVPLLTERFRSRSKLSDLVNLQTICKKSKNYEFPPVPTRGLIEEEPYSQRLYRTDIPSRYKPLINQLFSFRDGLRRSFWIILELMKVPRKYYFSLNFRDHSSSKFYSLLQFLFFRCCDEKYGHAPGEYGRFTSELIHDIRLLQAEGFLPPDLSNFRCGPSNSTLLHLAINRHFDHKLTGYYYFSKLDTFTPENKDRIQRFFAFFIRDCGIHPFELVNQMGFSPFHTCVRFFCPHPSLHWVIRMFFEDSFFFMFEKDIEQDDHEKKKLIIEKYVNTRVLSDPKLRIACESNALHELNQTKNEYGRVPLEIAMTFRPTLRYRYGEHHLQLAKYFVEECGADVTMKVFVASERRARGSRMQPKMMSIAEHVRSARGFWKVITYLEERERDRK